MPKIEHSIEINSTKERLWQIISDVDNESEYWWGTKEVRNISREGNEINREITQNFRNSTIKQKVILHPNEDSVEVRYLKGINEGVKILTIEPIGENSQRLKAFWDIHFPGIYRLGTPVIKRHVERGTIAALERVKKAAEVQTQQAKI